MELKLNMVVTVVVSQIFEVAMVTYNFQPTKLFFRFEKDLLYEMALKMSVARKLPVAYKFG